ncbi:SRSO17 transposase [Rhizobium leguminosarum]|uniref:SRSO17 transposase n=1 Tax=Rhizobium leguminosarum TaxID=384 RepID=A0AAE2MH67_RHILE|nr:SRSO17 transposase [Rhizobium leguminosarum]MBB4433037.1 SRSO17 transposase [Rhizobium esperanzae]MBB4294835.1 SRSO17 transposase [Rhizobium leguminosarum]MBB4306228.1 SRSO17 transposase [Rhizobium leguminosarum]MBB4418191.1 SRSO17 transposase [Rhizobium leguminosarum]
MTGVSIEATLELWASSLRDVKARMRPLFTQERVANSACQFLDGLLGKSGGRRVGCGRKGSVAKIPLMPERALKIFSDTFDE